MKKIITYGAFSGILMVMLMIGVALWQKESLHDAPNARNKNDQTIAHAPAKMIALGPVGSNIKSTEQVGEALITITASRFWIKKTKTFGFDNALLKRLAASDFTMTVAKAGKQILSAKKDLVEMPLDRSSIVISKPKILFPAEMGRPDSIRLDKSKKLLIVHSGEDEKVWHLDGTITQEIQ